MNQWLSMFFDLFPHEINDWWRVKIIEGRKNCFSCTSSGKRRWADIPPNSIGSSGCLSSVVVTECSWLYWSVGMKRTMTMRRISFKRLSPSMESVLLIGEWSDLRPSVVEIFWSVKRYIERPVIVRYSLILGLSSDLFHQYKGEDSNTMGEIKSADTFSMGVGREMREEIRGKLEIQITQLTGDVTDKRRSRTSIPFRWARNEEEDEHSHRCFLSQPDQMKHHLQPILIIDGLRSRQDIIMKGKETKMIGRDIFGHLRHSIIGIQLKQRMKIREEKRRETWFHW